MTRPDLPLVIHGHDYTPEIQCDRCGRALIADPNGNAPLEFTLSELVEAVRGHTCEEST
jgi:hypothetical protein